MPVERINLGDVVLQVLDEGRGRPVLFVHGFPLDHTMWREQVAALLPKYRVIAPDLRGFGASGVTEGKVTMEQFANDLDHLLDAIGVAEPVVLCGLSMGGYIAWQFFRIHGARLRGLVLCDTKAAPDTPEGAAQRLKLADLVVRTGTTVLSDNMLPKLFHEKTIQLRPEVVDSIRTVIQQAQPHGVAAAQRGMAERPDVRDLLPRINVPALVICGESDAISPVAEMQEIAQAIPNARLVVVPEAGHMAPLENPSAVNRELLAFLESLE